MIVTITTFLAAATLALVLVPLLARYVAEPLGLVDRPDNNRKLHKTAIPLVGGIAVFIATLTAGASLLLLNYYLIQSGQDALFSISGKDQLEFVGLVFGASFLLLVGIVDDSVGIRGRQKLLGQFIAVSILVAFGYQFHEVELIGFRIQFGHFSALIVFAWMLVAINSVNLLDGADGFATTIGIVTSFSLGIMSMYQGKLFDCAVAWALTGALVGFLKFNFPPAKVYLGDAGSMLVGFILAALAIRCSFTKATAFGFFAPIALLAIPLIDTTAAIIRRRLTGRSVFAVDRGHIHHTLAKLGYSPTVSLIWVAVLCSTTSLGAIFALIYGQSEVAVVSILIVIVVMVLGRIFGIAELQLVSRKLYNFNKTFVTRVTKKKNTIYQSTVQLQGNRDWKEAWELLSEFAEEHELNEITFDLNLPWIHESFHANRRKADANRGENQEWYSELPVIADGRIFGRIEIKVSTDNRFSSQDIVANLLKLTSEIETVLAQTADTASVDSNLGSLGIETDASGSNGKARPEKQDETATEIDRVDAIQPIQDPARAT